MKKMSFLPRFALILCASSAAAFPARGEIKTWTYPGADWQTAQPEDLGMDAAKIADAFKYLGTKLDASETVLIRRGYLLHRGKNSKKRHGVWSTAKSFTSATAGLLVDSRKIALGDAVHKHVPAMKASYSGVTFRHFATMTSGYDAKGGTYGPSSQDGSATPFAVSSPSFAPGKNFAYWDDAMNLYGLALSRAAGKNFAQVFDEKIARKIGIKRYQWSPVFQDGSLKVSSGSGNKSALQIDAEEMARFCYLYLSEGSWDKQEILSKQWVYDSTQAQVPVSLPVSKKSQNYSGPGVYGYNWWVNGTDNKGNRMWPGTPARAFAALGAQTNFCIVVPEWELVVVRLGTKGASSPGSVQAEFLKRIGAAIRK